MDTVQGTPAWFNARQGKLTASRFGAAAGICPFASRNKALRELLGHDEWKGSVEACTWGTLNEKNAIKDYMVRTGNVVKSKGFFTHPHYEWLGGSPDGLVGDEGIIEVKCPFFKQVPHERIPPHYLCQINGLLEILDKQWCDYVSWTPTAMKVYRVYRDDALWSYLLERYMVFYASMKRGVDELPRCTDKQQVLDRINATHVEYDFWACVEPSALKGRWDAPPNSNEEDENGTDGMGRVPWRVRCNLEVVPSEHAVPLDRCVYCGPEAYVQGQPTAETKRHRADELGSERVSDNDVEECERQPGGPSKCARVALGARSDGAGNRLLAEGVCI